MSHKQLIILTPENIIRTELGGDAVILSNRITESGVEIHVMENNEMEGCAAMKNDQTGDHGRANLVVAISSRALFNLDESHAVFENDGIDAYCRYQVEREEIPLMPGVAFGLVSKLLALNARDPDHPCVEVILLSRNSADTGLRIFNSIRHHGLAISRAAC